MQLRLLGLSPSEAGSGTFCRPTVPTNVDHSMASRDETSGPVLPVTRVEVAEQAGTLVSGSRYGLSAVKFTKDHRRVEQLARQLNVGMFNINDVSSREGKRTPVEFMSWRAGSF
ncbi:aldehyde dehydrogenase family protein [Mycobacteroides franklinii]|uniref:aldehyde dehydrogenase family protein n=1 Tax=Mycobacteroides franklinii TaxID=948102 RepID=UPI0009922352|nr:aldehyde dehydrogenase family protein [Mycobacteroides franklinii]